MTAKKKWWGDISFDIDGIKVWTMGERKIAVQRLSKEYLIWNAETHSESTSPVTLKTLKSTQTLTDVPFTRHLFTQTHECMHITPALADRPIVARPASKLNIPPGEQIEIYVSTPLWFVVKPPSTSYMVADIPFWRPSDSWFGPSTMEGELCYAKYTDAKVSLAKLEKRPTRAITPVLIKNEHDETLTIERINLPAPFLTLYADTNQQFWTDRIEITHHNETEKAGLRLTNHPPSQLESDAEIVSIARISSHGNHFVRSIKSLLG
jgi:hypothetical protein